MGEYTNANIKFALETIPNYDGNPKTSYFCKSVEKVQQMINTLRPAINEFQKIIILQHIKSKIIGKAEETLKNSTIETWNHLKNHLICSF